MSAGAKDNKKLSKRGIHGKDGAAGKSEGEGRCNVFWLVVGCLHILLY